MRKTFLDMPGWVFDMDEVSAGVYEVIGTDRAGHSVSAKGTELDDLIKKCKQQALGLSPNRAEQGD